MAETASTMLPLGTIAPDFQLIDTRTGNKISLSTLRSDKATVIMFLCNHCPYVVHIREKLLDIVKRYQQQGVSFIAINSNDIIAYPADDPKNMRLEAEKYHYSFPYLFDEDQSIAKAYHAACTPDFFVFDKHLTCVYRGRFDDATPRNQQPVTGKELSAALDCLLQNQIINFEQKPSLGCNIKWKM